MRARPGSSFAKQRVALDFYERTNLPPVAPFKGKVEITRPPPPPSEVIGRFLFCTPYIQRERLSARLPRILFSRYLPRKILRAHGRGCIHLCVCVGWSSRMCAQCCRIKQRFDRRVRGRRKIAGKSFDIGILFSSLGGSRWFVCWLERLCTISVSHKLRFYQIVRSIIQSFLSFLFGIFFWINIMLILSEVQLVELNTIIIRRHQSKFLIGVCWFFDGLAKATWGEAIMIVLVLLITTCHKENYKFIATISTSHQTAYYFVWKHLFYSMQPSNLL